MAIKLKSIHKNWGKASDKDIRILKDNDGNEIAAQSYYIDKNNEVNFKSTFRTCDTNKEVHSTLHAPRLNKKTNKEMPFFSHLNVIEDRLLNEYDELVDGEREELKAIMMSLPKTRARTIRKQN